jgi:hypothetical protein
MRNTSRFVLPFLAVGVIGATMLPAVTAAADTTGNLSISSFHQIVADTTAGYLFFSEGALSDSLLTDSNTTSPLVITNLSGTTIATIDPDGVEGLALSPDGTTLYAALAGPGEVAAINIASIASDPTAPTQTLYPLASGDVPYSVAVQNSKVWVSYNPGTNVGAGSSAIGDISLSASSPASAFEPATAGPSDWYSAPDLAADPSDSGTLVATQPDMSSAAAATFNTTTDPATPIATPAPLGTTGSGTICGFEDQVTVLAGGAQFAAACGPDVYVYNTSDVATAVQSYATTSAARGGPVAVAIAPDGTVAAGTDGSTVINAGNNTDIVDYVYSPGGGTTLRNVLHFAPGYGNEYPRAGLAWSSDGSELFSVDYAQIGSGWQYQLQTFTAPETTRATLSLNPSATVELGKTVNVSGTLALSTGYPPSGTEVTVTRTMSGTATETKTLTTGSNGAFSFTDAAPPTYGTYTYTASYAGNSTTTAATTTASVTITRLPTTLTLTTNGTNYSYGSKVTATAHLGTTYTGRTVTIYEEPFGGTSKKALVTARVNSSGNLSATYTPTTSTTFSASFSGDAKYAPATTTHNVYIGVGVSLKISGYYTTAKHSGITYKVFHHTAKLTVDVTVTPNKRGECVELEVQEYYSGGWHSNVTTGCGTLNSSSQVSGYLTLTDATGGLFRIRADYIRSSADTRNLDADSGWSYFSVVR